MSDVGKLTMNMRPIMVLIAAGLVLQPTLTSAQTPPAPVPLTPGAQTPSPAGAQTPSPAGAQTPAPTPSTAATLGTGPIQIQATTPPLPGAAIELKLQTTKPLKLQDAIDIILANSPQLKISALSVDRSEAVVRQARAGLFPTVALSASYTYNQSAQGTISNALFAQSSGGAATNSQLFTSETAPIQGQIQVNYNVFTSGLVGSRILAANENLQAARLDYERIRQDLINTVIGSYYDLQASNGNVEIAQAAVRSGEASLRDAKAQEKAGVGTRFAVLQADVQLANAQQQLLQSQNQLVINQRNLARQLNFSQPTAVEAADVVEKGGIWQFSEEDTIFQALNGRVELAQQLAIERAAKANESVAYASVNPQVSIFVTGQAYDNLLDTVTGIYTGYSGGIQVQWTAFDGGSALAQADQAADDAKTARFRYIDTRNSVRYSVENSLSTLTTANLRIDTASAALVSATEALRLARLRFQAGVGTQTDVINADRDLTQARVNRLIAIIDYNRALAAIKRATGTL
jgi:outer membrane factor, OMF family